MDLHYKVANVLLFSLSLVSQIVEDVVAIVDTVIAWPEQATAQNASL